MEHVSGVGDGGKPGRHDPFEDFRHGVEDNDDAEGCWGVVRGLTWLV